MLVANFEYEKAFDLFYDEALVKHENEDEPIVGLSNQRLAMKQFLESISNKSAVQKNVLVSDDITVTEWHYIFDHNQWGHRDFIEVTVQRWRNGKIIHERHHYKTDKL